MKITMSASYKIALAAVAVSIFSGCGIIDSIKNRFSRTPTSYSSSPSQGEPDQGPVVVLVEGEPVLRKAELDSYLTQMLQFYPQLQNAMTVETMPASFKKTFLNKLIEQEIIIAWAKKQNLDQNSEFKKSMEEALKLVRRHLLVQQFEKDILNSIAIADAEIRADYDANKMKYIKEAGGTMASAVKFNKDVDAQVFMPKAKGKESDLGMLAKKEKGATFRSFGRVNADTQNRELPQVVKDSIVRFKGKIPALITVRDGSATWIVGLSDPKETSYFGFDEIKGQIEAMLRNQKFQEELAKKMDQLKNDIKVEIKEELLAPLAGMPMETMDIASEPEVVAGQAPAQAPTVA